jgi:hypothetical protein
MKLAGSVAAAAELLTLGLGGNNSRARRRPWEERHPALYLDPARDGLTASIMPSANGIPLSHESWNATRTQPRRQLQQHAVAGGLHDPPPWLATIGTTRRVAASPEPRLGTDRGGQAIEPRVTVMGWASGRARSGLVCLGMRRLCFAVRFYEGEGCSTISNNLRH